MHHSYFIIILVDLIQQLVDLEDLDLSGRNVTWSDINIFKETTFPQSLQMQCEWTIPQ